MSLPICCFGFFFVLETLKFEWQCCQYLELSQTCDLSLWLNRTNDVVLLCTVRCLTFSLCTKKGCCPSIRGIIMTRKIKDTPWALTSGNYCRSNLFATRKFIFSFLFKNLKPEPMKYADKQIHTMDVPSIVKPPASFDHIFQQFISLHKGKNDLFLLPTWPPPITPPPSPIPGLENFEIAETSLYTGMLPSCLCFNQPMD